MLMMHETEYDQVLSYMMFNVGVTVGNTISNNAHL